jgi:hypothetical protein
MALQGDQPNVLEIKRMSFTVLVTHIIQRKHGHIPDGFDTFLGLFTAANRSKHRDSAPGKNHLPKKESQVYRGKEEHILSLLFQSQ